MQVKLNACSSTDRWSWRLISPSLTLSTSCQSSSQITARLHSPSVNSPSNYLIPILLLLFIYFAPLHPSIFTCTFIFCTSITPVLNCSIVIISPIWHIYCLYLPYPTSFAHTVYRFFYCVIGCTFVYVCVTLWCLCRTTLLYLGQVAVVNENLFSTGLPGWIKVFSTGLPGWIKVFSTGLPG